MNRYREPEGDTLLEACSNNVVVFAEKMLGFKFYAWQVNVLSKISDKNTQKRIFSVLTSRQIGKTEMASIFSLWATFFNRFSDGYDNNTVVAIISISDEQAGKLLETIKNRIFMGDKFMENNYKDDEGNSVFGEKFFSSRLNVETGNNARTVTWRPHDPVLDGDFVLVGSRAGSIIRSYPPTTKILGGTFSLVIIDEAARNDKIEDSVYYDYVEPTANVRDAKIVMFSTPWSRAGFFYRFCDPDDEYEHIEELERFSFPIDSIKLEVPEYYDRVMNKISRMQKDGKTDEVQRAYYCRFVQGEQSFFDPERVEDVFNPMHKKQQIWKGECDLGIDFGAKSHSRTVITISRYDEDNGLIYRIYDRVYNVKEDENLVEDIAELMKYFNIQRIIYDDADTGRYVYEEFHKRGWNAFPMSFRKDKVNKYAALRGLVNTGRVFSYIDEELKTEMMAMENRPARSRTIIGAPPGYYDDKTDSWVCSCFFFLEEDEDVGFISIDKPKKPTHKQAVEETRLERLRRNKKMRKVNDWFGGDL